MSPEEWAHKIRELFSEIENGGCTVFVDDEGGLFVGLQGWDPEDVERDTYVCDLSL